MNRHLQFQKCVADELHDGMAQWLAKREAESELPAKIIQFPRQL
jgi:hypothetical protein